MTPGSIIYIDCPLDRDRNPNALSRRVGNEPSYIKRLVHNPYGLLKLFSSIGLIDFTYTYSATVFTFRYRRRS